MSRPALRGLRRWIPRLAGALLAALAIGPVIATAQPLSPQRLEACFAFAGHRYGVAPLLLQAVSPAAAILLCGTGIVAVALAGLTQPSAPADWQAATQAS